MVGDAPEPQIATTEVEARLVTEQRCERTGHSNRISNFWYTPGRHAFATPRPDVTPSMSITEYYELIEKIRRLDRGGPNPHGMDVT